MTMLQRTFSRGRSTFPIAFLCVGVLLVGSAAAGQEAARALSKDLDADISAALREFAIPGADEEVKVKSLRREITRDKIEASRVPPRRPGIQPPVL
jgi:hypothetical protein